MADDKNGKKEIPLGSLGAGAGGTMVGIGLGLTLGNAQVATKTIEWILDKGLVGFALLGIFIIGTLYLREKAAREEDKERLYRELIDTIAPVRVALELTKAALLRSDETLRAQGGLEEHDEGTAP